MVEDDEQGHGLGTALLESLVQRAVRAASDGSGPRTCERTSGCPTCSPTPASTCTGTIAMPGSGGVEFELVPTDSWTEAHAYRDDVAQARSIARLLSPASIAVVGAGRDERSVGRAVVTNLVEGGFEGPVYPVNRHPVTIAGRPAVPTVLDIDGPVDLAVVAVPAAEVGRVAEQCAEKGVHGLVVISGGFAELDDGAARQRELVAQCRQTGMRLVGPNCVGIVNTDPDVCMNATFSPVAPVPGHVGCASQSGGVGIELLARAHTLGLGVSTFVSMGNKADVSGNDLMQYWTDDPGDRRGAPLPRVVRQPAHVRSRRSGAGAAQAHRRAQERPQHRRCTRLPFPHRRAGRPRRRGRRAPPPDRCHPRRHPRRAVRHGDAARPPTGPGRSTGRGGEQRRRPRHRCGRCVCCSRAPGPRALLRAPGSPSRAGAVGRRPEPGGSDRRRRC